MATGTPTRFPAPAFHDDDPEQTIRYRSLSVLAIVGLVFGLASPLSFGAPLLMAIPVFGAAISWLALRRIAASEGALAGRWAAVTGLALCVVFGVAPISREWVIESLRSRQAVSFARDWLDLMRSGKTKQAFGLTIDSQRRPPPPEPGMPKQPDPYDKFVGTPVVKDLVAAGPDSQVRFEGTVGYEPKAFPHVYIRQRYEILPPASKTDAHPVDLLLTLERLKLPAEGRARWMIFAIDDAKKPTATALSQ